MILDDAALMRTPANHWRNSCSVSLLIFIRKTFFILAFRSRSAFVQWFSHTLPFRSRFIQHFQSSGDLLASDQRFANVRSLAAYLAMEEHVLGPIRDIRRPLNDCRDVELPSEVDSLSRRLRCILDALAPRSMSVKRRRR